MKNLLLTKLKGRDNLKLKNSKIKYKIETQGQPVISNVIISKIYSDTILLIIDMESKNCGYSQLYMGSGDNKIPGLIIDNGLECINLNDTEYQDTEILFPELKGWNIFSVSSGRYSFNVTLTK